MRGPNPVDHLHDLLERSSTGFSLSAALTREALSSWWIVVLVELSSFSLASGIMASLPSNWPDSDGPVQIDPSPRLMNDGLSASIENF